MLPRWGIVLLGVALGAGCSGSRWARDDPDYAAKYPHHTDNVSKMTKQAVDARHVIGKKGVYGGFAGSGEPAGAGAEAGLFVYPRSWLETRVGAALLAHEGEHELSGGGLLGARVQTPSRLAPFVGVSGYAGYAGSRSANKDGFDNDGDGETDEFGESETNAVMAIAPELGVHYWITSRVRLTGNADYRMTTDGRGNDLLYYGMSLAVLGKDQHSPPKAGSPDAGGWKFSDAEAAAGASDLPVTMQPLAVPPASSGVAPYKPDVQQTTIPEVKLQDLTDEGGEILRGM